MEGRTTLIVIYSLLLRALQGIASSTMQVSSYAVGTTAFPEKSSYIVGGIEAITGLGMILGPKVSTVLF
jgi:MFS family permease